MILNQISLNNIKSYNIIINKFPFSFLGNVHRFHLPLLPTHNNREVVDTALDGSYRRLRFTTSQHCITLGTFFGLILPILLETVNLLTGEAFDLKICPFIILLMRHLVGGEEREEKIYLALKAALLSVDFVEAMESQFTERLEAFTQRGTGFSIKAVEAMEWDVVQYRRIPFLVGHGSAHLPPKLAAKKAVVNVKIQSDDCFR
jgi:hypothetical protein